MRRDAHRAALSAKRMTEGPEESDSDGGEIDVDPHTGWPAGMAQDDSRDMSRWLASKPDARQHAREAAAAIGEQQVPGEPHL